MRAFELAQPNGDVIGAGAGAGELLNVSSEAIEPRAGTPLASRDAS